LFELHYGKKYFRERGIRFKDVDVSRDAAAARNMMRRSSQQGVPVIDIGALIYTLPLTIVAMVVAFVGLMRGFSARAGTQ